MLWFNFILDLIFVFFTINYHTKKQEKEIEPKIKLNHNILYMLFLIFYVRQFLIFFCFWVCYYMLMKLKQKKNKNYLKYENNYNIYMLLKFSSVCGP